MKISMNVYGDNNLDNISNNNINYIHIDVDDSDKNIFQKIYNINNSTTTKLDIYLNNDNINNYIIMLKDMNIEYITVPIDKISKDIIIKIIKNKYKVGVSINKDSDISLLNDYIEDIDLILLDDINSKEKLDNIITNLKKLINNKNILIEVRGNKDILNTDIDKFIDIVVIDSNNINKKVDKVISSHSESKEKTDESNKETDESNEETDDVMPFILCIAGIISFIYPIFSVNTDNFYTFIIIGIILMTISFAMNSTNEKETNEKETNEKDNMEIEIEDVKDVKKSSFPSKFIEVSFIVMISIVVSAILFIIVAIWACLSCIAGMP